MKINSCLLLWIISNINNFESKRSLNKEFSQIGKGGQIGLGPLSKRKQLGQKGKSKIGQEQQQCQKNQKKKILKKNLIKIYEENKKK